MALGPRRKSELELHWRLQADHLRAEMRNLYRRMANDVEADAFELIAQHYMETGELLDLAAQPGQLNGLMRKALPPVEADV